ncbi:MAG TPA: S41 family peptidase [Fimbriimonadaceae bacterium]|nr:S41 family peptidase [Fimbriimonadaceae bacterium]
MSLIVLFALGFSWRDIQSGDPADAISAFHGILGGSGAAKPLPEQEFQQAFNRIQVEYYRPIEPKKLKYAGISGMMASLGDPHTMFLVPQIAREFDRDTKANYVGVGAKLSTYTRHGDIVGARAVAVFSEGPGYAAGLRRGDVIVGVNGKSVEGLSVEEDVDRIMGQEGTLVKLSILKSGEGNPVVIAVRRSHVVTPTVESTYFPQYKVGYIYIASFSEPTAEQFDRELAKVEQNPLRGLVIDVRGNPGGYLETAVEMLSRFKANKVVVGMKMRDGSIDHEYTVGNMVHDFNYPIAILINGDSASAAEIFSGALRDYKVATLVGTHSYGKASVQEVYPFKDGSSGKVTIARYFLPLSGDIGRRVDEDGSYISGGLEPDVKVEEDDVLPDDLRNPPVNRTSDLPDPADDNQLRRAIEVVLSKAR